MTTQERERLFLELYEQYRERVQRICQGYMGGSDDAEDLFQEVMTRVWDNLPSFRGEAQPGTWIYRIAVNAALLHRRKTPANAPLVDVADTRPAPHEEAEKRQRIAALRQAIAGLSEQNRIIATLLLEGISYKEIAEITGITVNHVGVKLTRIKQAIEKSMREAGYGNI